jgi:hypothetical protein
MRYGKSENFPGSEFSTHRQRGEEAGSDRKWQPPCDKEWHTEAARHALTKVEVVFGGIQVGRARQAFQYCKKWESLTVAGQAHI